MGSSDVDRQWDSVPGWPDTRPIRDWLGRREHRGRRYPVSGCGCIPCRTASAMVVAHD